MENKPSIISLPFIFMVKFYQKVLSPILPNVCRYQPSCSQYMIDAITTHGVIKGIYLGTKRILRCHPLGGSGYDPVPPRDGVKTKGCTCQDHKLEVKDTKQKTTLKD